MTKMIVFGEDWGAHPSSTQHLMKSLSNKYEIVWVNSIGLRKPKLDRRDLVRVFSKLRKIFSHSAVTTSDHGIIVVNPLVIPWPGSRIARWLNGHLLRRCLRRYVKSGEELVLWTSLPSAVDVLGKLGESIVVYYCGDDFSALAGVDHRAVTAMEKELVRRSDLVLVASDQLHQKFSGRITHVIPHGVDVRLFSQVQPRPKDLPSGKPIAGFYGAFADWIDVPLLVALAKQCDDWNFVFVGPILTDPLALKSLPNVFFLGEKPHQNLPGYSQHWQVSLLPFKDCPQIRACNPLKLREYLAAGTAIVSAPFPALDEYIDSVYVAYDADTFAEAMRRSLREEHRKESIEQYCLNSLHRQMRVKNESWESRAAEVERLIRARLGRRGALQNGFARCEQV